MKNIVVSDSFHQSDLKPAVLVKEYMELLCEDIGHYFVKAGGLKETLCPACQCPQSNEVFNRFSLFYRLCASCGTLFISSRPSDEALHAYYQESASCRFWRDKVLPVTQAKRDQKIIHPRVDWILDSVSEYLPQATTWVDVNTSQPQFLEAMAQTAVFTRKFVLNPHFEARSASGSLDILPVPWWKTAPGLTADVVTLFEVLDQTSDVAGLVATVRGMLNKGGLCFLTAILASGFDVKELGPFARNIYPPDRLNVFSVKGLKILMEANGFECLELSTPGILDVEIVAESIKADPLIPVSSFTRDLVLSADEGVRRAFQEFLQANLLSSYGRILVRKI